jgi:predicted DCC family thiol-disulfide oxidoreductase YuxK
MNNDIYTQPIILFDGICNFCNRMVNFAIRNDKKGKLKFAPLQSDAGIRLREQFQISPGADTIVFVEKGKSYMYAKAAIRICKYLDWPAKALYAFIIIPPFISQPLYKWFAKRRYKWFGKRETCMIPTPEVRARFLD